MEHKKNCRIWLAVLFSMILSLCASCGKTEPAFESREALKDAIQGQWTMDKSDLEHVEGDDPSDIWHIIFSTVYDDTEYVTLDIDTENNIITSRYIDSNGEAGAEDVMYIEKYNYKAGNIILSSEIRYHVDPSEDGLVLTNMANGHEYTLYKN